MAQHSTGMDVEILFPTPLFITQMDIDHDKLLKDIIKFSSVTENAGYSNIGGYQGHFFENEEWMEWMHYLIPMKPNEPRWDRSTYAIHNWVNVNPPGSSNSRHAHISSHVYLAGVHYVQVPENSGCIRFYDPRGPVGRAMPDGVYWEGGSTAQFIQPKEGMVLFFPNYIEHDVEENKSDDTRVSIGFNIMLRELDLSRIGKGNEENLEVDKKVD